jgi:hypothetical protein
MVSEWESIGQVRHEQRHVRNCSNPYYHFLTPIPMTIGATMMKERRATMPRRNAPLHARRRMQRRLAIVLLLSTLRNESNAAYHHRHCGGSSYRLSLDEVVSKWSRYPPLPVWGGNNVIILAGHADAVGERVVEHGEDSLGFSLVSWCRWLSSHPIHFILISGLLHTYIKCFSTFSCGQWP